MRQLPGIVFETVPPPPADSLPRMDIAAFVGFAQSGPLDVPVAVEDPARFRDLFGADVALGWDAQQSRVQYGLLGSAVEAFFANGGRRCFVTRVAHGPLLHRFDLPNLRAAGGPPEPAARVRARSPGAWAGALRAGTTLQAQALRPRAATSLPQFDLDASGAMTGAAIELAAAPGTVGVGDLLELSFVPTGLLLFGAVSKLEQIDRGLRATIASRGRETAWRWASSAQTSPPAADGAQRSPWLAPLEDAAGLDGYALWQALPPGERALRVRRLSFEITAWRDERLVNRVGDLSFCPRHPRYFGNLPSDETLFAAPLLPRADGRTDEYAALRAQAAGDRGTQRFPFSGPADGQPDGGWPLYLPDGMDLTRRYERAAAPLPSGAMDAPAQDGLTELDAALFVDPRLQDYTGESLLRSAEQMHRLSTEWYQRPSGPRPQRLRGVHALFPVQECTLLAAPDAAQRPWSTEAAPAPQVLAAPWLDAPTGPDAAGRVALSWSAVAGATEYLLEWDESPEFDSPQPGFDATDTAADLALPPSCAEAFYFRVRAQRFGEPSPWSNTRIYRPPANVFLPCAQSGLPELKADREGTTLMTWSAQPPGTIFASDLRFRVEEARNALFEAARVVAEGSQPQYAVPEQRTGLTYYRVRALHGAAAGPWSNALAFGPAGSGRPLLAPLGANFDDSILLDVHRALLRLCAARGDLLALLALPRHFGAAEALDYLAALAPDDTAAPGGFPRGRLPLTGGEAQVMSYGALYHPWTARTVAGDPQTDIEFTPPDGAVAGQFAACALTRGAWVSAANQPLSGVLALEPPLTDAQLLQLTELQLNLVRRAPRGFLLTNDETLSRSADVRAVSVRRLLILLKRLALREGASYVFEPLSSGFADRVRRGFERVLSNLHLRGAFQGETDEQAFRVVVDASVNPPRSLDLGRFVVELGVAPSRPLAFLRIRLTQSGPQELTVGES